MDIDFSELTPRSTVIVYFQNEVNLNDLYSLLTINENIYGLNYQGCIKGKPLRKKSFLNYIYINILY